MSPIWNDFCFLFRNYHFHNFVSTSTNVVKLYVEKDNVVSMLSNTAHISVEIHNVDSTLFDVVNANVEIHNVVSTLIWGCIRSWRHINQKTTLKQRWSVWWKIDISSNAWSKILSSLLHLLTNFNH